MLPSEGRRLFREAELPLEIVKYDPVVHGDEMRYLATGLIGALISIPEIESISGPELGSRIPIVVIYINKDWLRMYIDPVVEVTGKNSEHRHVTAYTWEGGRTRIDTSELLYAPWQRLV